MRLGPYGARGSTRRFHLSLILSLFVVIAALHGEFVLAQEQSASAEFAQEEIYREKDQKGRLHFLLQKLTMPSGEVAHLLFEYKKDGEMSVSKWVGGMPVELRELEHRPQLHESVYNRLARSAGVSVESFKKPLSASLFLDRETIESSGKAGTLHSFWHRESPSQEWKLIKRSQIPAAPPGEGF